MKKYTKYALFGVAGAAVLFTGLLAVIALTFDPNHYKPLIIKLVQEKKQRTLTLEGDIKLTLFPRIGADLGRVAISEHNDPKREFAAIGSARVALAILPLLRKELVVDQVRVDGLSAHLVRNADGTTNFDDLLKKEEESPAIKFDVSGINIRNASLTFDDRQAGRQVALTGLRFESGRLANGVPGSIDASFQMKSDNPRVAARIDLASRLLFDLQAKRYALNDMNASVNGIVDGFSTMDLKARGSLSAALADDEYGAAGLNVTLAGRRDSDDIEAKLEIPRLQFTKARVSGERVVLDTHVRNPGGDDLAAVLVIPSFEGTGQAFNAPEATINVNGRQAGGTLNAKLTANLSGSLEARRLQFDNLDGSIVAGDAKLPKGGFTANFDGSGSVDLPAERVQINLGTKLDDSTIKAKLALNGFAAPHYGFDVAIDQLDLDRYLPKSQAQGGEKPFDFSALKKLNATGRLEIGKLQVANVKTTNFKLEMKADAGKISAPVSASLYQGNLNGTLQLDASSSSVGLRSELSNISVGPLLKDAINQDVLEGRGKVALDVTARGTSAAAMKKSLQGRAAVELRDGALKGINLAGSIRDAKASLGALKGKKNQDANLAQKTDFSELKASFAIDHGVARNSDLSLKSPLVRVAGAGEIDVGEGQVNYLTKASIVGTLEGQGGKEAAALRGLTVPVRAAGPYAALTYTLDFDALAGDAVRQTLEAKKEDMKARLGNQLKSTFQGLFR